MHLLFGSNFYKIKDPFDFEGWFHNQYLESEIKNHKNHTEIKITVPGIKREEITVELDKDVLYVTFSPEGGVVRTKTYTLGGGADPSAISASLNLGILTINVPKREAPKKTRIEIS